MTSAAIASGLRTASTSAPARSRAATIRRSWSRSLEIARTRRFDKGSPDSLKTASPRLRQHTPGSGRDVVLGRISVLVHRREVRAESLVGVRQVLEMGLVIEE